MYVTKEQVEAMIAQALANGPAAQGESTTDRKINSLAETVKALGGKIDTFDKHLDNFTGWLEGVEKRTEVIEKDIGFPRPAAPVESGPMETATDPGAVAAHASASEAPLHQPPAAESTQG